MQGRYSKYALNGWKFPWGNNMNVLLKQYVTVDLYENLSS